MKPRLHRESVDADLPLVFASQAVRAFGYGLGSVLLASTLAQRGLTGFTVGLVLGALLAGTVVAQLVVAGWADRLGRRRSYRLMYLALGVSGLVFAGAVPIWALVAVALTGALSAEVIESGPFTTLELSMLSGKLQPDALASGFGWYNAIATAAGSLGALAAGLPQLARNLFDQAPPDRIWFLLLVPVAASGMVIAGRLSPTVELDHRPERAAPLQRSRGTVIRLAGLFSLDAFAGGFVVHSFIAFWLIDRLGASTAAAGALFAAIGVVQTFSYLAAPRIARRIGLLNTMVFTHLPSNLLLAGVAFAPTFPVAAGLLLARAALSQMDVPTRQAYVITLVDPEERTAATAYTNTARYLTRPLGPALAGAALTISAGIPFLIAGALKSVYDLTLWGWFRTIPLPRTRGTNP